MVTRIYSFRERESVERKEDEEVKKWEPFFHDS